MSPQTITYRWITRGIVRTLGAVGLILGVAMCVGGPERFAGPGFATARLVPGGVYAWGASLAIVGAIVVAGVLSGWHRGVIVAGLYLQFLWFLFFAIGLVVTTAQSPQGAVTGPVAYGGFAVLCLIGAAGGRDLRT